MEVVHELPPNIDKIMDAGMQPNMGAVLFAYGDKLYIPGGFEPPEDLMVHEEVHSQQQEEEGGVEKWWDRYLEDKYFRIDQEVEAYAEQYRFLCIGNRDGNKRAGFLHRMAVTLSGPTYGNVIAHSAARKMIKDKANVTY